MGTGNKKNDLLIKMICYILLVYPVLSLHMYFSIQAFECYISFVWEFLSNYILARQRYSLSFMRFQKGAKSVTLFCVTIVILYLTIWW